MSEVRIDKFLWAMRIYKTRSIAADACKNGRITMNGVQLKPSRTFHVGDTFSVRKGPIIYTYRIQCTTIHTHTDIFCRQIHGLILQLARTIHMHNSIAHYHHGVCRCIRYTSIYRLSLRRQRICRLMDTRHHLTSYHCTKPRHHN